jgi:hypothetical protein
VYGREQQRQEDPWNVVSGVPVVNDPIDRELSRLGITLASPSGRLEVRLPQGQRKTLTGQHNQRVLEEARGKIDRAALMHVVSSPQYQRLPDYDKERILRRVMSRGGQQVSGLARRALMRNEPLTLEQLLTPGQRALAER